MYVNVNDWGEHAEFETQVLACATLTSDGGCGQKFTHSLPYDGNGNILLANKT